MKLLGCKVVVLAEKPFTPVGCGGVRKGLGWQQVHYYIILLISSFIILVLYFYSVLNILFILFSLTHQNYYNILCLARILRQIKFLKHVIYTFC